MDSNKTSVKVHHAPGGASSFSLGWGNDEPAAPAKAKPIVADVGGVFGGPSGSMRSQNNIGADGGERTSVKVHHAPGGQSSFSIFDGSSGSSGGDVYAPPASLKKTPEEEEEQQRLRLQAEAAAAKAASYGKENIISGGGSDPVHSYGPGKFGGAPAAGQGTGIPTSVKVHNPPGGKSQISFG